MSALTLVIAVFAVLTGAVYQGYITRRISRNTNATTKQKVLQVILVWILPVLGAAVVHVFLISDSEIPVRRDENFVPNPGNDGAG
jgi:hypothetical protein